MNVDTLLNQAMFMACRFGVYAILNLAEDAAMLALMFC